jgi:BTB/POZ domain/BTB And C-terminal Kelch
MKFFWLFVYKKNTFLGKWSDCSFLVGSENNQQTLACHKIILAMASPVFETMFFGSFNQKDDPITISDVQADAFKALLEYIYTDKININNVDKAFDLCYAAKKYMLPYVVDNCTKFLWSVLSPKNACRAYEFAKLFEEPSLQEKCLQIICTKTMDVINDPSFEEVELSTIITILDQDALNVDNELALFFAINRFAEKQELRQDEPELDQNLNDEPEQHEDEQINVDAGPSHEPIPPPAPPAPAPAPQQHPQRVQDNPTIRDAVKKIRFLTLTPKQFAEGPARTNLLSQSEAYAILINISTSTSIYPMPENFTLNKNSRVYNVYGDSRSPSPAILPGPSQLQALSVALPAPAPNAEAHIDPMGLVPLPAESPNFFRYCRDMRMDDDRRYYCIRTIQQIREIYNRSVLESSFTFSVDRNVSILGLTICTQIRTNASDNRNIDRYSEILYAHLLDSHGSRLTYTHSNQRVSYDSDSEILFERPMFIQSNKIYKIGVVFNKIGFYQEAAVHSTFRTNNITFTFNTGSPADTIREGLIRGIIYNM